MSMTQNLATEQKPHRRYKKCPDCGERIDITDNPRGAVSKHRYRTHPEFKAHLDNQVSQMNAARRERSNMGDRPEAVQKPLNPSPEPTPSVPGQQVSDNVTEEVMAELRRQELEDEEREEGGNGANPGGNGHQDIDAGDAENIFLRTVMNPAQRTRAMIPKMMRAESFGEAQIAAIVPKTIVINPMLIQIAMAIAINEWGWDPKLPPGVMVDEFIKWLFWYCGWEIAPYRKLTPQEMGIVVTEGGG